MQYSSFKYFCITLVFSALLMSDTISSGYAANFAARSGDGEGGLVGIEAMLSDTTSPFCGADSHPIGGTTKPGCKDVQCTSAASGCSKMAERSESSSTAPSYCYCCPEINTGPATGEGSTGKSGYQKCDAGAPVGTSTVAKNKDKTLANGAHIP